MKKILTVVLGILLLASSCNGNLTQKPKEIKYKVTFKEPGEEDFKSTIYKVLKGSTIITINHPDPKLSIYKFIGWYKGNTLFDKNTPITEDIILVAKFDNP